ncbi:Cdc15p [Rhizophagus irregularis DAOM 197198w]|uniref:Cdc15p n=3 Tax=Rhizophagus irregularis TaxID=588596 RepID=A0A015IA73_RHIIW|nr:Cdc15p [Rhizophagus irregularis DAOM 197198w]
MDILNKTSTEKPRNLWKDNIVDDKYQRYVTISSIDSATKSEEIDDRIIYMDEIEKRKEAYGICGECNEPGTGERWCQSCNSKRFKESFKNWTSGNNNIDELIQYSQLNALIYTKCLEWIPFEKFQDVTYITRGGFGKIYSAKWPEGHIQYWDIENQEWIRNTDYKVALKIKSHLQIYFEGIVQCFGITQDPNTKDYAMVLYYCNDGNLRNYYLNKPENDTLKLYTLSIIAFGLLNIHNAERVHKDFHSGNILYSLSAYISDLGMCQPANAMSGKEGVYGVLPYMAPEVIRGYQYTKASDIYSFGIIMNEYLSEEIPFNNIPHDEYLAVEICKGFRPKISESIPELLASLIMKCWDANAENRPTAKELYQIIKKWDEEEVDSNSEIYSQMDEYKKIRENKLIKRSSENKPEIIKTHPQAIYTSRLLNFKNLPEPANSSDLLSSKIYSDASVTPVSECLECEI